ncbi:MAG: hypothetical protein Q9210_003496 [Variospora velana]
MFTLYGLDKVQATKFDRESIMLYHYPAEWTTNGQGTPFNTDLSDGDGSYIHFVYPPDSLDAGQFNTLELRPWNKPTLSNKQTKLFSKQYPTAPRVPLGLTSIDIGHEHNIRITAAATDITRDKFTCCLDAWADTVLYSASLTYLEAGPGFEYLRTGTFSTTETWTKIRTGASRSYATDIDTKGFTVHIDSWDITIMYQAGMNCLAYPANQTNVASGAFSTDDIQPAHKHQLENTATVKFDASFAKTPKIAMALSGFDFGCKKNLRLRLSTSAVTPTGVTWHLQAWEDSIMYRASASYFAWI